MKYMTLNTRMHLIPVGESLFCEAGFTVEIEDQAAGEYVVVRSQNPGDGQISVDSESWPALKELIDKMVASCREEV
jgi:hypothetical protein